MTNIKKSAFCVNCGKILNPKTLVCDACGTDYNEKPNCEHFYNQFMLAHHPKTCSTQLLLRCEKCKETISLNCSDKMIFDFVNAITG